MKASGDRSDKTEGQAQIAGMSIIEDNRFAAYRSPLTFHLSPAPTRRTADPFPLGAAVCAHSRKVSAHQFDPGSPFRVWGFDSRYLTCPLIPVPQNLLFAIADDHEIAVVDWECAQIGDAAYDLAIVTRGVRRPLGVANGLQQLVSFYNETAEQQISPSAVAVHELLLHLHWLAESQTENRPGGHGPEHYAGLLGSILRRALALDANRVPRISQ